MSFATEDSHEFYLEVIADTAYNLSEASAGHPELNGGQLTYYRPVAPKEDLFHDLWICQVA